MSSEEDRRFILSRLSSHGIPCRSLSREEDLKDAISRVQELVDLQRERVALLRELKELDSELVEREENIAELQDRLRARRVLESISNSIARVLDTEPENLKDLEPEPGKS